MGKKLIFVFMLLVTASVSFLMGQGAVTLEKNFIAVGVDVATGKFNIGIPGGCELTYGIYTSGGNTSGTEETMRAR